MPHTATQSLNTQPITPTHQITHPNSSLTFDTWQTTVNNLIKVQTQSFFMIGDLLNYGKEKWNLSYGKMGHMFGIGFRSAQTYGLVAKRIAPQYRREGVPWTFYLALIYTPEERWTQYLDDYQAGKVSSYTLMQELKPPQPTKPIVKPKELPEWLQSGSGERIYRVVMRTLSGIRYHEMLRKHIKGVVDREIAVKLLEELKTLGYV